MGAHSDDIEIGCLGTLLTLINRYPRVAITWVVLGAANERSQEALESASIILKQVAEQKIIIQGFRDGFLPYLGIEVKDFFEELKQSITPNLIFTHYRQDRHQDHRFISDLTWSTFRDHLILEYEIPKYDGDLSSPNFFFEIDEKICKEKTLHLIQYFSSQKSRQWFTEDTFLALMRLRGIESNAASGYAEAFYCRKVLIQRFSPE
nr:PIG-L deacetylase family protein [Petrachloros mirabilis]